MAVMFSFYLACDQPKAEHSHCFSWDNCLKSRLALSCTRALCYNVLTGETQYSTEYLFFFTFQCIAVTLFIQL